MSSATPPSESGRKRRAAPSRPGPGLRTTPPTTRTRTPSRTGSRPTRSCCCNGCGTGSSPVPPPDSPPTRPRPSPPCGPTHWSATPSSSARSSPPRRWASPSCSWSPISGSCPAVGPRRWGPDSRRPGRSSAAAGTRPCWPWRTACSGKDSRPSMPPAPSTAWPRWRRSTTRRWPPIGSWCSPVPSSTTPPPPCPPTSAIRGRSSTTPSGSTDGPTHGPRATRDPWCWSGSAPRIRTRDPFCGRWSTPSRRCRCGPS